MGKEPKENQVPESGPTLRDIAEATGLGLSTVSYALRNNPNVSKQTCEQVQKKAAEMGYMQNPLVRTFMKQVRHGKIPHYKETIAFLTGYPEKDEWKTHPFIVEQFEHTRQTAKKHGYEVEPFWLCNPDMSPERLARILLSRGIRAVIVSPLFKSMEFNEFPWSDFHSIAIGYSLIHPTMHRGIADLIQTIDLIIHKVFDAGCRFPLVVIPDNMDKKTRHQFTIAAQYYIKELFKLRDRRIIHAEQPQQIQSDIVNTIAKKKTDVIIGSGITHLLKNAGLKVPKEIGYASLNRISSQTAGTSQQWNHIASASVQFLISQIESNSPPGLPDVPVMVSTPPVWHDGPTLKPVKVQHHQDI